jgi:threonine dehydratase
MPRSPHKKQVSPADYLARILNAKVYDVAQETALDDAPQLSARTGNRVLLKREDQQSVFSFKLRGAYNKIAHLNEAQRKRGVIAASAGNHAQGVALAAQRMGLAATIVMPTTTPAIKIEAVKARGANVLLHGDSFSDSYQHAVKLGAKTGATFVHPFDDPDVIAGQGTIGMELLRQAPNDLAAVFVAVGGGGLIAGIGAYVKAVRPGVKVIAVQPKDSSAMTQSLKAKKRIALNDVGLFADGVAVKLVGKHTFALAQQVVDDTILVDTDEISAAIKDVFVDTRSILEPAGALAVAGLKAYAEKKKWKGKALAAIACGANMNFDRLRFVAERAEIGEAREALFAVTLDEKPGSFRRFVDVLGARNVTEFNYRYADKNVARVFVGLQISARQEGASVLKALRGAGFACVDMTDNELAKSHVRHLVGGHSPEAQTKLRERVFRFEFPERPGALARFLQSMNVGWNITLFHYRNHGSDSGRVFVGMQVPANQNTSLQRFIAQLGYPCIEETNNPAYQLFLGR